ncbi:MAG: radical SAM protein [Candidatus Bathyarchaeia archaeon]
MQHLSPEEIWNIPHNHLLRLLEQGVLVQKSSEIHFYAPSFIRYETSNFHPSRKDFLTISITGRSCALRCKHCNGKILGTMHSATTPKELYSLCSKFKFEGAKGCLISGGCLPDGSVPLDRFIEVIKRIKLELGLTIFAHVGIISYEKARLLREAGVDAALIDIIGDDETIKEIYNLNLTIRDYENSLDALSRSGIAFVPHVIAGLHYGRLKGEFTALKMIAGYNPSAIVIIAFMPIRGTEMFSVKPPEPLEIARVLAVARVMFPNKPLVLGCMRPKGKHRAETDVLAIKAGVNAIAFPAEEAVKYAEEHGYVVRFSTFCCSQVYKDFMA